MFKILTEKNVKDFKYFKWSEFACHCKGKYCGGHDIPYSYQLVELLTDIRKHFGKPIIITSPTRCVEWNKKNGGTTKSRHTWYKYDTQKGTTATDFYIKGVKYDDIAKYVKTIKSKYNIHYYYNVSGSVMHLDINPKEEKEKYNLTRILKKGCKGDDVKKLQKAIGTNTDGVFGDKTKSNLKSYQKANKITADGVCGKTTAHKLGWLFKGK